MGTLLTETDQKEALSRVYVKALAARAGYSTSVPEPDRDSVDLRVQAGGPLRPAIDLQLKATTTFAEPRGGFLRFRLPIKNYRDLREVTQTPRLLVVLELPSDESRWMTVTHEDLILRRRAYWLSLQRDHEEVVSQKTVTVRIPEQNLLDVEVMRDLMERSRKGQI
ncbi:MAG: DUF4365 domain-containing protein [Bryobacterales bacterium]|nr:DUF4365 domain-containing protein [Bryobacterales bacterium]